MPGEPVLASSPGTLSTPATPPGVVGTIVDGETPVDVGVVVAGAVVGGAVVGGAVVVSVGPQLFGRSTVAVTVFMNSSGQVATTVIVISPVTPPGTSVVAVVLEAARDRVRRRPRRRT